MDIFPLLICVCACLLVSGKKAEEELRKCDGQHVCTTLMKYKDNTTVNEGPNCECQHGKCSDAWSDPGDPSTLTWQHYERAHWSLQYKFCAPIFTDSQPPCLPGSKMAVKMDTPTTSWRPRLTEDKCYCPNHAPFKIMSWKREAGMWHYVYACEKPECEASKDNKETPCAKIYVDLYRTEDKVDETVFKCNCPDGYLCPAKYDAKKDKTLEDEKGRHVVKMCKSIVKKTNKANNK